MLLKLCYASKSVGNGQTDGRTYNPEAICPSNFFEVGGITKCLQAYDICADPDHPVHFHVYYRMHQLTAKALIRLCRYAGQLESALQIYSITCFTDF